MVNLVYSILMMGNRQKGFKMKKETKEDIVDLISIVLARTGENISKNKIQEAREDEDFGREVFWNIVQNTGKTTEEAIKRKKRSRRYRFENY